MRRAVMIYQSKRQPRVVSTGVSLLTYVWIGVMHHEARHRRFTQPPSKPHPEQCGAQEGSVDPSLIVFQNIETHTIL